MLDALADCPGGAEALKVAGVNGSLPKPLIGAECSDLICPIGYLCRRGISSKFVAKCCQASPSSN